MPSINEDNFDLKHVNNNDWKDADVVKENQLLLRRDSVQSLYKGYYYDKMIGIPQMNQHSPFTKQSSQIMESGTKENENVNESQPTKRKSRMIKDDQFL